MNEDKTVCIRITEKVKARISDIDGKFKYNCPRCTCLFEEPFICSKCSRAYCPNFECFIALECPEEGVEYGLEVF